MEMRGNQTILLPSLSLFWVFTDGVGEFNMKAYIKDPSGVSTEIMSQKMNIKADGASNLLLKMAPFTTNAFGEFECLVDLGEGHKYKRKFRITNE